MSLTFSSFAKGWNRYDVNGWTIRWSDQNISLDWRPDVVVANPGRFGPSFQREFQNALAAANWVSDVDRYVSVLAAWDRIPGRPDAIDRYVVENTDPEIVRLVSRNTSRINWYDEAAEGWRVFELFAANYGADERVGTNPEAADASAVIARTALARRAQNRAARRSDKVVRIGTVCRRVRSGAVVEDN